MEDSRVPFLRLWLSDRVVDAYSFLFRLRRRAIGGPRPLAYFLWALNRLLIDAELRLWGAPDPRLSK